MSRCMIHNVRMIVFEDPVQTLCISYTGNQYDKVKILIFSFEFLLNIVNVVLVDIKDYQLFGAVGSNLSG